MGLASPRQKDQHLEALFDHHRQLEVWAEHNPVNFENRAAMVGAEIARIGSVRSRPSSVRAGIRSAHAHGFVHNEAISNELAARFYAARGLRRLRPPICATPDTAICVGERMARCGNLMNNYPGTESGQAGPILHHDNWHLWSISISLP